MQCRLDTLTGCHHLWSMVTCSMLVRRGRFDYMWRHAGRWRVCTWGVVLTKNIKDLSCTEGCRPEYSQCSHVMINFSTTKVPTVIMGSCPCSLPGMHYLVFAGTVSSFQSRVWVHIYIFDFFLLQGFSGRLRESLRSGKSLMRV